MITDSYTHDWEISPNNIVEVYYTYSQEDGDYLQPPYESIEIDKMVLNGDDVTDRFDNYIEEITDDIIETESFPFPSCPF